MVNRAENLDYILHRLMADYGQQHAIPATLTDKQRLMRALMNVRQPVPASDKFLEAQNQELQQQAEEKGIVRLEGEGLQLWRGDITRLKVDAIVNAANAQLLGCWSPLHACIDNCIHSAAGIQLRQECYELMQAQGHDEPTGQAKVTKGYNLPARYVIHTVGPIISDGYPTPGQEVQLASCYRSCLAAADEVGCESIAFCCISTGVFHFPNHRAAEIAVTTVRTWLQTHPATSLHTIVFNVFLDKDHDIYRELLV